MLTGEFKMNNLISVEVEDDKDVNKLKCQNCNYRKLNENLVKRTTKSWPTSKVNYFDYNIILILTFRSFKVRYKGLSP